MSELRDALPSFEDCIELDPADLAVYLLEFINSRTLISMRASDWIHSQTQKSYSETELPRIKEALLEAWAWLENNGLIGLDPSQTSGSLWRVVTRRGRALKNRSSIQSFQKSICLPRDLLHPVIFSNCWADFLKAKYDQCVLSAFAEIEYRVRELCEPHFKTEELMGVNLLRRAFSSKGGPLFDPEDVPAEADRLIELIAGSYGWCKNPQSHRRVGLADPRETGQLLVLASYLLEMVEKRGRTVSTHKSVVFVEPNLSTDI
ncbi:MAG: hypothetical protein C0507_00585 [Cyanobacteria bacterium PR.3.49]|nr:hypothetical protein [Cyanobacteria bacterium PR.3.49]